MTRSSCPRSGARDASRVANPSDGRPRPTPNSSGGPEAAVAAVVARCAERDQRHERVFHYCATPHDPQPPALAEQLPRSAQSGSNTHPRGHLYLQL